MYRLISISFFNLRYKVTVYYDDDDVKIKTISWWYSFWILQVKFVPGIFVFFSLFHWHSCFMSFSYFQCAKIGSNKIAKRAGAIVVIFSAEETT